MQQELDQAIDVIHLRFGEHALARVETLPAVEGWATGIEALDRLTGVRGLPKGRVCVLQGRGTCGKTSLALALLARATREFAHAIAIDPGLSFDPWALMGFGPELGTLTVVRPPDAEATGEAVVGLARAGAGFLLLNLPARVAAGAEPWLPLLAAAAERSEAVVVAVVEAAPKALAHASSVSFGLERTGWRFERGELVGIRARVTCVKNKVGMPGAGAELEINYPLGAGLYPDRAMNEVEREWTEQRESAVV
jgi:RecA/RadA recombinase